MFLLAKPNRNVFRSFLERAGSGTFSYSEIGATESDPPGGYNVDHNRIELGYGDNAFRLAKIAIEQWKMFGLSWIEVFDTAAPVEQGQAIALLIRHFGFYSLNATRIVYVINESTRFGFAYGTLAEHGEIGEERFLVELDDRTGKVYYDILAFSRPGHLFAKLGYPLTRFLQKRFAKDSMQAMKHFTSSQTALRP